MRRAVVLLLALTVALVLADSAIVTLALPDIVRHLDASVTEVAWVLISFNVVLALACVPAARLLNGRALRPPTAAGIAVFAAASAWCAAATSMPILITARCLQAVGGAVALMGCLDLLVAALGSRRGVRWWVSAGVLGTGLGPVAGGLLTQAISWQAIFVVQVPFAVVAVPAALAAVSDRAGSTHGAPPPEGPRERPDWWAHAALGLLSAAVNAALFLLVLLLVEGWRHPPAVAALVASVVPAAALAAGPLCRWLSPAPVVAVATGAGLMAGGLAALAWPPSAHLGWTVAPQVLVGLGLGLGLERLTVAAMADRAPRAEHAAWTVTARHLGIVVGLVLLTPIFSADLVRAQTPAEEAITALVLDAPMTASGKIALAQSLNDQLAGQSGKVPDLHPAFAAADLSSADRRAAEALEPLLDRQLERAASWAFRTSFLVAALLAALALLPLLRWSARGRVVS